MKNGLWIRDRKTGNVSRLIAWMNREYEEDDEWMWRRYDHYRAELKGASKATNRLLRRIASKPKDHQPSEFGFDAEQLRKRLKFLCGAGLDWRHIDVGALSCLDYQLNYFLSLPWDVQSQDEHPKSVLGLEDA